MNDKLKNLITNIGILCEMWMVVYRGFAGQGMNQTESIMHTQAFMDTLMKNIIQLNGNKE